jgi:hypothetical protein
MAGRNESVPEPRRIRFRIGLNLGDVVHDDTRIYDDGINIAARLESLADPGGVLVSRAVYEQVHGKLPVAFEDTGEHRSTEEHRYAGRRLFACRLRAPGQPRRRSARLQGRGAAAGSSRGRRGTGADRNSEGQPSPAWRHPAPRGPSAEGAGFGPGTQSAEPSWSRLGAVVRILDAQTRGIATLELRDSAATSRVVLFDPRVLHLTRRSEAHCLGPLGLQPIERATLNVVNVGQVGAPRDAPTSRGRSEARHRGPCGAQPLTSVVLHRNRGQLNSAEAVGRVV